MNAFKVFLVSVMILNSLIGFLAPNPMTAGFGWIAALCFFLGNNPFTSKEEP